MKSVILAGGQATRLRPLTCLRPKAMVPIANTPFMEHFLNYLRSYGVTEAILALGHLPDQIRDYFGNGDRIGVRLIVSIEDRPLGTAGAVKNAERYLDDLFLVFNGDVLTDIDLGAMLEFHHRSRALVTIALVPVEDPSAYGVADIDDTGMIRQFIEKPPRDKALSNLINAGIYLISPDVLKRIPSGAFSMFEKDVFPGLSAAGKLYGYCSTAYWIDIGTPAKYLTANHDAVAGRVKLGLRGALSGQPLIAGTECRIAQDAEITGPVMIGNKCVIASGSRINGPTAIGDSCRIGRNVVIDQAVLWDNVTVEDGAVLRHCVICSNTTIGTGVKMLDGCLVGENVTVKKDSLIDRGCCIWPDRVT
ncbi:MAG: NDP-sugar synthase [Chloroflexota bacterium]